MSESTPEQAEQPTPEPNVLADSQRTVGSAYDPMPMKGQIDTSRNWLGIVSLVFGILGGSLIAIVCGLLGLSAVKNGKASNPAASRWGITLGILWLVVEVIVIAIIALVLTRSSS